MPPMTTARARTTSPSRSAPTRRGAEDRPSGAYEHGEASCASRPHRRRPSTATAQLLAQPRGAARQAPSTLETVAASSPRARPRRPPGVARREFMQLIGASLALAGADRLHRPQPDERIVPFTKTPPSVTPGNPLHYASGMTLAGHTSGLLVTAPRGPPGEGRGQPAAPGEPGRRRRLRAGLPARPLRSAARPRAAPGQEPALAAHAPRGDRRPGGQGRHGGRRRRAALPHRAAALAAARPTCAARIQQKLPQRPLPQLRPPSPHDAAYDGHQARVRPAARAAATIFNQARHRPLAGRRLPGEPPGEPRLRAPVRRTAATEDRAHQPPLRGRAALLHHRRHGGPPPARRSRGHPRRRRRRWPQAVGGARRRAAGRRGRSSAAPGDARKCIAARRRDLRQRAAAAWSSPASGSPPRCTPWPTRINAALGNVGKTVRYVAEHRGATPAGPRSCAALVDEHQGRQGGHAGHHRVEPGVHAPADASLAERCSANGCPSSASTSALRGRDRPRLADWFVPAAHQLETLERRPLASTARCPSSSRSSSRSSAACRSRAAGASSPDEPDRPAAAAARLWRGQSRARPTSTTDWEALAARGRRRRAPRAPPR